MPFNTTLPPPPVPGPGNPDVNYTFGDYSTDQLLWADAHMDHMDLLPFQEQPYVASKIEPEPYWYAGAGAATASGPAPASGPATVNVVSHHPHPQASHHPHGHQQHPQHHSHPQTQTSLPPLLSLHPAVPIPPLSISASMSAAAVGAIGVTGDAGTPSMGHPSPYNLPPTTHPSLTSSESFSTTTTASSNSPPPLSASPESPNADPANPRPVVTMRKPAGSVSGSSIICEWPTCKKVFTRWRDLNHHWLSHEKPFSCPTCGHRAATKTHLRRHTNTHRREEKYYCQYPGCYRSRDGPGKPFYRKDNCRNHMKDVHGLFEESNCS